MRRCAPAIVLALAVLHLLPACAQLGTVGREEAPSARATELFARLVETQEALAYADAALAAHELIQNHSKFPKIDEVFFRAGTVAMARNLHADAARHFEVVDSLYPLSPFRARALVSAARAYAHLEMDESGADALLRLLGGPVESPLRDEAVEELRTLVRTRLGDSQLEALLGRYPDSVLSREIALQVARREYASGDYESAYKLLTEYLYRYPEGDDASEARRLLRAASERRGAPGAAKLTSVNPNVIGVVLPVTGPGSLYGRQFARGVETALEHHNEASARQVTLVTADSKASAAGAVKAVRRLLLEDGAIGIVGSVFTMPTIAACVEANAWGAAMLSPVVSNDDLQELGQWVFQTKVPLEVEVTAIAETAVRRLLIERFAVVAPSRGTRHELAKLFADEVRRLGGRLVAVEYYEERATDFREQLEPVREAAPEAIFASGSVDELLLLLPQIKFYDLQVQLLGLSNWNTDKLLRLSRDALEGALFPSETYRGTSPAAYVRFDEAMREKGVAEINPITEAGYFGMRLMLQALDEGASSREDVSAFLTTKLRQGASGRMAEAGALSLQRVRGGRVVDFAP